MAPNMAPKPLPKPHPKRKKSVDPRSKFETPCRGRVYPPPYHLHWKSISSHCLGRCRGDEFAVLGASWGLLWDFELSSVVSGAILGGLGGLLELLGVLLGRSWTVLAALWG
eukprot:3791005-Karenia_brevis.AAC.1